MKSDSNYVLNLVCFLLITQFSFAQESVVEPRANHIFLELGGNGIVYSLNYERLISENFSLRAGAGVTPGLIFVEGTFFHFPLTANYMIGSKTSKFEIGFGATLFTGTDAEVFGLEAGDQSLVFLTGTLGYRYISEGGFVFRIGFTPLYNSQTDPQFSPSGGLSFGYLF